MYVSDCIQILILSYAIGSIPFGIVLAKLFRLPDPRTIGSGNIGATNMLRTGNKKVALLTLLLDAGKGVAAVLLSAALFNAPAAGLALAVTVSAVGHMYTPWLRFKGGKGVATLLGGTLAFSWPVGIAACLAWLMFFLLKQYVSLASIAALAFIPLIAWLRVDAASAIVLGVACGIAIWRHRENIKRLREGFEPRMSLNKGPRA